MGVVSIHPALMLRVGDEETLIAGEAVDHRRLLAAE